MLVADLAENLLQHVFERDHAGNGAELVHHHRQMRVAAAELVHKLVERFGFRHHQRLAHIAPQAERARGLAAVGRGLALLPGAHQVLVVHDADDVLRAAVVHRKARVLVLERQAEQLVQAGVHRHRDDVDPRHHDLARVDCGR